MRLLKWAPVCNSCGWVCLCGWGGECLIMIQLYCVPETHLTRSLWAHNPNLIKLHVDITWKILTRSGHNFAHVTTAELSWHVQSGELIRSIMLNLEQKEFWQDLEYKFINVCEICEWRPCSCCCHGDDVDRTDIEYGHVITLTCVHNLQKHRLGSVEVCNAACQGGISKTLMSL